jgi:hypothetical protein
MKTTNNMKKLILSAAILATSFSTVAQVGIGTTSPDVNHALEIFGSQNILLNNTDISSSLATRILSKTRGGSQFTFAHLNSFHSSNIINIGGGTGAGEPATHVNLVTGTSGALGLGSTRLSVQTDGDIIINENLGLGVDPSGDAKLEINGQIKITQGSPGANKVLTSDANGLATWEDPASGGKFVDGVPATDAVYTAGSVGIGITSPSNVLHVHSIDAGDIELLNLNHNNATGSVGIRFSSLASGNTNYEIARIRAEKVGGFATRLEFYAHGVNGSTLASYMTINHNGNVGIGTNNTNPSEKLHVDGNILATGTITPDYVFESYFEGESSLKPSYKMMSLEEIESFTKENKHLPGVPSAKEVKTKGGIVLNRQAEIQLEKIEELYLHTIEQQKQIDALQAQVKLLMATKTK